MVCKHCQMFLGELSKTPYASEFDLICVDKDKCPIKLPSWLKIVPTLVIQGESEPRVGPGPVTNWLFERRLMESSSDSSIKTSMGGSKVLEERSAPLTMPVYSADVPRPTMSSRTTISHIGGGSTSAPAAIPAKTSGSEEGPTPYHINEMGANKLSDSYGFLADAFSIEKGTGTNRIVRNFAQLHDVAGGAGVAGTSAPKPTMSKKEEALIAKMEEFTKRRDMDIPGPFKRT